MAQKNYFKSTTDPSEVLVGRLIQALNHPVRRRILEILMQEPASSTTLAELCDMSLNSVAYHLATVLGRDCNVVRVIEVHQRRGAHEYVYAIKPGSYVGLMQWQTIPEPIRSGLRGASLHSFLRAAIAAMESEAENPRNYNHYSWRSIAVDEKGHREIDNAIKALTKRVKAIEGRCSDKHPTEVFPLILGTAAFESAPIYPPKKLTA